MNRFARLLDGLLFTPGRLGKLRLIEDYLRAAPDPDRGWALAALAGGLDFRHAKPATVRELVAGRVDPVLFDWSYDFVGDLAETAALIWPARAGGPPPPALFEVVCGLDRVARAGVGRLLESWLDGLDATGRWALLKLVTGGLRVGVSARLAKTAAARLGPVEPDAVEEVWHGLVPPYGELFAWLEGRGPRPSAAGRATFTPMMLAHPLDEAALAAMDPAEFRAEWKWDGIRVQLAATPGERRVFSRTGEDVAGAFPEIAAAMGFEAVLDGELLVGLPGPAGAVAPFNDLQQRLNRKVVTAALRERHPAFVRLYDILAEAGEDLRPLPFDTRRARLEAWFARVRPARMDLSEPIAFAAWDDLARRRGRARADGIEGLMLKRAAGPYLPGRPKGHWFKWKRDAHRLDCVLLYAQRGHGKRSSFYSDYTFGLWDGDRLVPVGKAYSGFTDEELVRLDRWVRAHTMDRYGPVRAVEPGLVLEIAFDDVQRSTRHKSGLAMRFPRVGRIRWDKPAAEADRVESLAALLPAAAPAPE